MHETKRRHSDERRARNASAAAITERALALAARGDHREAARTALLAERLHRLEPKLRHAKACAETQHARAEAAIAEAQAAVAALTAPPSRVIFTEEQLGDARRQMNIATGFAPDWRPPKNFTDR